MRERTYSYQVSEVLLTLLLSYYYLYHAFLILPIEIFTVSLGTIILLFLFSSFVLVVTYRHFKTFSLVEYSLILLLLFYAILGARHSDGIWFKNTYLYWAIFSVFLGIMMSRDRGISAGVFWLPFMVIVISLVMEFILYPGKTKDMSIFAMHRNVPPMIATTFAMLISMNYAIQERLHCKFSLILPYILVLVNFYSNSRAGLIIGIMYFFIIYGNHFITRVLGEFRYNANTRKQLLLKIIVWLILTTIFLSVLILNSRLVNEGVSGNGRMDIYTSFQEELHTSFTVTGFTPQVTNVVDHLHNSFFQLIAYAGLFSIPMFLMMLVAGVLYLLDKNFLALFFGIIGVYSLVEYYVFLKYGDLILFPLIVFSFYERSIDLSFILE